MVTQETVSLKVSQNILDKINSTFHNQETYHISWNPDFPINILQKLYLEHTLTMFQMCTKCEISIGNSRESGQRWNNNAYIQPTLWQSN